MKNIDIVFDRKPGHEGATFIDVEDADGKSIEFGLWIRRTDGTIALRFTDPRELAERISSLEGDLLRASAAAPDQNADAIAFVKRIYSLDEGSLLEADDALAGLSWQPEWVQVVHANRLDQLRLAQALATAEARIDSMEKDIATASSCATEPLSAVADARLESLIRLADAHTGFRTERTRDERLFEYIMAELRTLRDELGGGGE